MADNWWLIASTPTGGHLCDLGPDERDDTLARRLAAARLLLGFPVSFNGMPAEGWAMHLAPGEPHPKLLAAAKVHDLADLDAVAQSDVDAALAASAAAGRQVRIDGLKVALAGLDRAARDEVLAAATAAVIAVEGG